MVMEQTTESELLNLISTRHSMSILEISTIMNLTKADIRYHVKKLVKKNHLIELLPNEGLPGRPAKRYKINPNYFNHNLENLISGLISFFPNKRDLVEKLSNYFFISFVKSNSQQPILQKLNSLVSNFSKMNYASRWETQFQGPTIFFSNCPYRNIIELHPELCQMDKLIISKFLNFEVKQINTIADGSSYCKFLVLIK
jgi:predicted ArsR family transcriptional regulator